MSKYKFVKDDKCVIDGHTLYRIQATRDFSDVKEGDLGGYIEHNGYNLSQVEKCWIYDRDCYVYGYAKVSGNAQIRDAVNVHGHATIGGSAIISGTALIHGNADISGEVYIGNDVEITGDAQICGDACVGGDVRLVGDVFISGNSLIIYPRDYMVFTHVLKENDTVAFIRTRNYSVNVSYNEHTYTLTDFKQYLNSFSQNTLLLQRYNAILGLVENHFGI